MDLLACTVLTCKFSLTDFPKCCQSSACRCHSTVILFCTLNMDALKRKVKETMEDIQRAENRHKDLIRHLRQATKRAELAVEEKEALEQRVKERKQDLENSCKKCQEVLEDCQAKDQMAGESEEIRKNLESKELEVCDQLVMLEAKVRDKKRYADEAEQRLTEAKVRYNTIKSDLSELLARLNTAESKICKLHEDSDSDTVRLINLEIKHRRYDKREEYFEDKIETMEQQIRNLETEAVENEAEAKLLQTQQDKLKSKSLLLHVHTCKVHDITNP